MNTQQLQSILKQDPRVGPVFRGVFPRDKLPPFRDGVYVINTDSSKGKGQHWVSVYITPVATEYFDSYGGDPIKEIKRWGKRKTWVTNPVPLQSPLSAVCGQYCIYYLLHRVRGVDMTTLLLDFGCDVDVNDQMVYDYINDRYNLDHLKLLDTESVISQLSQASISNPSIRKLCSGQ